MKLMYGVFVKGDYSLKQVGGIECIHEHYCAIENTSLNCIAILWKVSKETC